MVTVYRRPGESIDSLIKRFRQELQRNRVWSDIKKKRYYLSKSQRKRRKKHIAFLRWLKEKKKLERMYGDDD